MTELHSDSVKATAGTGWGWILAYGIASLVLGIFAFVSPLSATFAATSAVGMFLTVTGVMALAAGIAGHDHRHRGYKIALGVISIAAGLLTIFRPFSGALSITLLFAAWLFARGLMEIVWGARHSRQRVAMLALGVLNVLLAIFIVATVPLSALTLPGYVLGLSLVFGGVTGIASGLAHRKGASAVSLGKA